LDGAPYFILDFTEVRSCVAAAFSVDKSFVILNTELELYNTVYKAVMQQN